MTTGKAEATTGKGLRSHLGRLRSQLGRLKPQLEGLRSNLIACTAVDNWGRPIHNYNPISPLCLCLCRCLCLFLCYCIYLFFSSASRTCLQQLVKTARLHKRPFEHISHSQVLAVMPACTPVQPTENSLCLCLCLSRPWSAQSALEKIRQRLAKPARGWESVATSLLIFRSLLGPRLRLWAPH